MIKSLLDILVTYEACCGCLRSRDCSECRHEYEQAYKDDIKIWLASFDTESATKCFEAIQLLKEEVNKDDPKPERSSKRKLTIPGFGTIAFEED